MALIKCKECGSTVSSGAKACPSCGAAPKRMVGTLSGLIIIGVAIYAFANIFGSGTSTPIAKRDPCSDTTMAFVMSQNFMKKRLKSPATASFPSITADGVRSVVLKPCEYRVDAYVDSQNSFGATMRTRYTAAVANPDGGRDWKLLELDILE